MNTRELSGDTITNYSDLYISYHQSLSLKVNFRSKNQCEFDLNLPSSWVDNLESFWGYHAEPLPSHKLTFVGLGKPGS